jgi:hypothetical protein
MRAEIGRVHAGQAAVTAADRCPDGVNDVCLAHGVSTLSLCVRRKKLIEYRIISISESVNMTVRGCSTGADAQSGPMNQGGGEYAGTKPSWVWRAI